MKTALPIFSNMFSHKKMLIAAGLIGSALLVGLYILQVNHLTTLAYHIAEQEEQLMQFKYDNADLQATTFQAVSLKDLKQIAQERNFENIEHITYVRVSAGPVAQQ
jgi:hypothetical protein